MEFIYTTSRQSVLELLADLAGPWFEPSAFAGFGTAFQQSALDAGDDFFFQVEACRAEWVAKQDAEALCRTLLDIHLHPPGPDFHNDLVRRRAEDWRDSLFLLLGDLDTLCPEIVERQCIECGESGLLAELRRP